MSVLVRFTTPAADSSASSAEAAMDFVTVIEGGGPEAAMFSSSHCTTGPLPPLAPCLKPTLIWVPVPELKAALYCVHKLPFPFVLVSENFFTIVHEAALPSKSAAVALPNL